MNDVWVGENIKALSDWLDRSIILSAESAATKVQRRLIANHDIYAVAQLEHVNGLERIDVLKINLIILYFY